MKKILYLILIFLPPLFAASKGFTIKGNIAGLQTGTVTLAYINGTGDDTTLSTNVIKGMFTFTGTTPEPQLARLTITEGWAYNVSFFLENKPIDIHLVKDAAEKTSITGSVSEIVYEQLQPGLSTFFNNARQNEGAHHQTSITGINHVVQSADSLWAAQQQQWMQTIRASISANAENYAALYFIKWLLFKPDNYDAILSLYKQLSPAVRNGAAGKKFLTDFEHLRKVSVGQPAPEINSKDTLGRPVTLATFKGKVVLLDFWSSYCGPCRLENRRMIPVYEKYHAAGFEIVSLSLDNERNLWLSALHVDAMLWTQGSDLRGGAGAAAGTYDITDLPRNFLIDRNGKIYAKDIHGDDLTDALKTLLGVGK
jgi:thiol-disulfide isomerase/thioredoxin